MNHWLSHHPWLTYIMIYVLVAYIYNKVFRVRKLPVLKEALIYILIGLGCLLLLFFQVKVQLPIVLCMAVAVFLMFTLRVRMYVTNRFGKDDKPQ